MENIKTIISIEKPSIHDLQHFGIKGMHWGHRKSSLKEWGKEARRTNKNQLLHPIITGRANRESIQNEKSIASKARRTMLYQNTKDLKDVNDRIDRMVANKPKLTPEQKHARVKKVLFAAGAVTVTAALAYGGYKVYNKQIGSVVKSASKIPLSQAKSASSKFGRQSTKDLAKEMSKFSKDQAALRDQLRNLSQQMGRI